MRLHQPLLGFIDEWRFTQNGELSRAEIKELTRSIYVIKSEFPERSACWIRQTLRSHPAPQKAPGLKLAYSDGEADRHGDLPPGSAQAIVASNLFR